MSNVKNYHIQGGKKWVVEGELELIGGGRLLFNGSELKPVAGQADSEADTIAKLKTDFNALLTRLYLAGLMIADKSELEDGILAALELLEDAEVGDWDGAYPQAACDTFVAAIDAAQVVADAAGVTQTEIDTAVTTLEAAVSAFQGAVVVVNKSTLESTITSAQGILADAEVGDWDGAYLQEDYDTFSAAIDVALAVFDNAKATQDEVTAATTALGEAITAFQGVVVVVDKTDLGTAIATAQGLLSGATVGTDQGEYPQADYDTFSAAIGAAQDVFDDDKASQSDVDTAETTLGEAVTAFEESAIK